MSITITCNRVRASLKSRWQVTVPSDWVTACVEWIEAENEGLPLDNSDLNQMVYEQWLVSDLRELGAATLPPGLTEQSKVVLDGRYCLQVNSLVDASVPFYGQLTKIQGKENENVNVSASTQLSQPAWEAKPSRMLMLTMTDGVQEVHGMEYRSIPTIHPKLPAGTKVLVQGKVVCRLGTLMLCPENLSVLGGEVEAMLKENNPGINLERALNQNRELDQPQTARKEFSVEARNAQKQPRQQQQQRSQQQHQQQHNTSTNKQPCPDEWGDEDIDLLAIPDVAQLTEQQQWNVKEDDLEALMDDGVDDQLLASQPLQEMLGGASPGERTVPDAGSVPRGTAQWSARVGQQRGDVTPYTSELPPDPGVRQCDSDTARSSSQHTSQDSLSLSANTLTRSSVSQTQGHSEASARPFSGKTRQAPVGGAKPSRKVSPWKIDTSPTISSQVTSGPKNSGSVKQGPMKHDTLLDLHSLPFTYLVKVQESWPPTRVTLVTVKAYVTTVLGKLESNKGKNWSLHAKINDGSAAMDVILSDEILTSLIGFSATEYSTMCSQARQSKAIKHRLITGIKTCQDKLINMSAILDVVLDPDQAAPIVRCHRQVTQADCTALLDRNQLLTNFT